MLEDMDIPLWVLRERMAKAVPVAVDSAQPPSHGDALNRTRLQALQSDLDTPTGRAPAAKRSTPPPVAVPGSGPSQAGVAPDLGTMPAALQCTWLGAHAYVGRHYAEPGIRRFLRDLLVAAADDQRTPTQLPFDTADLVARVGLEQARLGLSAFVAKRLSSIGAGTLGAQALLLDEALQSELPGAAGDDYQVSDSVRVPMVLVPDLRRLQDDGPAKRALWLQLLALRRR